MRGYTHLAHKAIYMSWIWVISPSGKVTKKLLGADDMEQSWFMCSLGPRQARTVFNLLNSWLLAQRNLDIWRSRCLGLFSRADHCNGFWLMTTSYGLNDYQKLHKSLSFHYFVITLDHWEWNFNIWNQKSTWMIAYVRLILDDCLRNSNTLSVMHLKLLTKVTKRESLDRNMRNLIYNTPQASSGRHRMMTQVNKWDH